MERDCNGCKWVENPPDVFYNSWSFDGRFGVPKNKQLSDSHGYSENLAAFSEIWLPQTFPIENEFGPIYGRMYSIKRGIEQGSHSGDGMPNGCNTISPTTSPSLNYYSVDRKQNSIDVDEDTNEELYAYQPDTDNNKIAFSPNSYQWFGRGSGGITYRDVDGNPAPGPCSALAVATDIEPFEETGCCYYCTNTTKCGYVPPDPIFGGGSEGYCGCGSCPELEDERGDPIIFFTEYATDPQHDDCNLGNLPDTHSQKCYDQTYVVDVCPVEDGNDPNVGHCTEYPGPPVQQGRSKFSECEYTCESGLTAKECWEKNQCKGPNGVMSQNTLEEYWGGNYLDLYQNAHLLFTDSNTFGFDSNSVGGNISLSSIPSNLPHRKFAGWANGFWSSRNCEGHWVAWGPGEGDMPHDPPWSSEDDDWDQRVTIHWTCSEWAFHPQEMRDPERNFAFFSGCSECPSITPPNLIGAALPLPAGSSLTTGGDVYYEDWMNELWSDIGDIGCPPLCPNSSDDPNYPPHELAGVQISSGTSSHVGCTWFGSCDFPMNKLWHNMINNAGQSGNFNSSVSHLSAGAILRGDEITEELYIGWSCPSSCPEEIDDLNNIIFGPGWENSTLAPAILNETLLDSGSCCLPNNVCRITSREYCESLEDSYYGGEGTFCEQSTFATSPDRTEDVVVYPWVRHDSLQVNTWNPNAFSPHGSDQCGINVDIESPEIPTCPDYNISDERTIDKDVLDVAFLGSYGNEFLSRTAEIDIPVDDINIQIPPIGELGDISLSDATGNHRGIFSRTHELCFENVLDRWTNVCETETFGEEHHWCCSDSGIDDTPNYSCIFNENPYDYQTWRTPDNTYDVENYTPPNVPLRVEGGVNWNYFGAEGDLDNETYSHGRRHRPTQGRYKMEVCLKQGDSIIVGLRGASENLDSGFDYTYFRMSPLGRPYTDERGRPSNFPEAHAFHNRGKLSPGDPNCDEGTYNDTPGCCQNLSPCYEDRCRYSFSLKSCDAGEECTQGYRENWKQFWIKEDGTYSIEIGAFTVDHMNTPEPSYADFFIGYAPCDEQSYGCGDPYPDENWTIKDYPKCTSMCDFCEEYGVGSDECPLPCNDRRLYSNNNPREKIKGSSPQPNTYSIDMNAFEDYEDKTLPLWSENCN